jgi:pyruvate,orthophosphate dikinase
MVFGNLGEDSATGVAFTRDPSTGENIFYGEYLINAQGEDVVAGIRTPHPINKARKKTGDASSFEETMPKPYKELEGIYKKLEEHYREMQDIEFTVEKGKLWLLQTRTGKRTARAAVRIAIDMQREGLISKEEALLRVDPYQIDQLLHPMLDPKAKYTVLATGLPASPGAVTGKVVFTADEAEKSAHDGEKVILVRIETSPEDIHGMHAAQGILTSRGGMTSHAAVVARGMGKCCIAGCGALLIDYKKEQFRVGNTIIKKGDFITLDGGRGIIVEGKVPTVQPKLDEYFQTLMEWADSVRTMKVRTNADTPHDAEVAREFGAEGIGLCRTEHMFFDESRILAVREMIFAENSGARKEALDKILPMQKGDFIGIFRAMHGLPVTIRLLDPPLHEFLPVEEKDIEDFSKKSHIQIENVKAKLEHLKEFNPMLGHRGCRLGITYPEVYNMQVQAIMEAACELVKDGVEVIPEIMIPLVGMYQELEILRASTIKIADDIGKKYNIDVSYTVGTMIELPRAAVTADEIAEHADFFSFGTNDLTQTALGFSRDDAGKFLPAYIDKKIFTEGYRTESCL